MNRYKVKMEVVVSISKTLFSKNHGFQLLVNMSKTTNAVISHELPTAKSQLTISKVGLLPVLAFITLLFDDNKAAFT